MAINYAAMDYGYLDEGIESGDPKQLRIMKKLANHLARTPGYGDIEVFRGKGTITSKEAQDALSILEAPEVRYGAEAGKDGLKRNEQWQLLVQGWPKDDVRNPSDPAYRLAAAVVTQLSHIVYNDDPNGRQRTDKLFNLGGDISEMGIGRTVVRPVSNEQGNSRLAEFFVPLLLVIQTDKLNPAK